MSTISARYEKKGVEVLGSKMAYVEVGDGDPIVFLHGNPTSSFLWRNVMPHLEGLGRLVAPDLIGMGDSAKLEPSGPDRYRFVEHRRYLDVLFEQLGIEERVVLVVHDWGSVLGFDWANRHRESVRAIAYMEAIVQPLGWSDWPEAARGVFEGLRSSAGETMALERNIFVERVLPRSIIRELAQDEMDVYRRPFAEAGEGRRPTLTWPREIPIDGDPADVHQIVTNYAEWLSRSNTPKLFVNVKPGAILTGAQKDFCRGWPNQREITVKGIHFVQEDSPVEIGQGIRSWLESGTKVT